jgi:hypothetical protein
MKRIRILLTILMFTTAPRLALCSVDENQIVTRINFFFSVNIHVQNAWAEQPDKKNLDGDPTNDWIKNNSYLTPEFKQAYKKVMSDTELDSDPILDAQDWPSEPFEAKSVEIKGAHASAKVSSKAFPDHIIRVFLVKRGKWLINSTNEINKMGRQP